MLNNLSRTCIGLIAAISVAACEPRLAQPPVTTPGPPPAAESVDTSAAAQFAAVQNPVSQTAQVYGSYTRGCIAGAQHLPVNADHWQVLNPSRNRSWAHPVLISFIETLAAQIYRDGYGGLLVGDLAQPRGGPLPSDHNSHQVGLDADIWLEPLPKVRLSASDLEIHEPPLMVDLATLKASPGFGAAQYALVKHAAESPEVERIFISPPLKQALCERTPENARAWLRKIRPWPGHMEHMHVRLSCPVSSGDCKSQDPPPDGDGCGAELASWFRDTSWSVQGPKKYVPEKAMRLEGMPLQCQKLLKAHG